MECGVTKMRNEHKAIFAIAKPLAQANSFVRLKPDGTSLRVVESQSRISTGDTGITG
jgi:hypothetical protein